uniref:Protein-tyrosine-phosphatase n=1 Tax=Syphacia muris TaxID=451379 RepID=A0A0N5ADG3_9BILA
MFNRFHGTFSDLTITILAKQKQTSLQFEGQMQTISFKVNSQYAAITEVIPGLFICGVTELTAQNIDKYNITLIINATHEESNIPRIKLWIEDNSQALFLPHFDNICDQIHAELADKGNVLIHCVAGVSRSATLCLAYLTKYHCKSLRDAYHLMASKRPMVRPVIGFWRQLIAFEEEIKKVPASVRLIVDEAQQEKLLPDVYLKYVIVQNKDGSSEIMKSKDESYQKAIVGTKRKFKPVLEPLNETIETVTFFHTDRSYCTVTMYFTFAPILMVLQ